MDSSCVQCALRAQIPSYFSLEMASRTEHAKKAFASLDAARVVRSALWRESGAEGCAAHWLNE
jgi:hypothetical protein